MKQVYILIEVLMLFFSTTLITHAGQKHSASCEVDGKACLCETNKVIEACRAKIPDAEENAKVKSLFGYPSNRYIAQDLKNKTSCVIPQNCLTYLKTLKKIESEYQACQYAKKTITAAQGKKVRKYMNSIGMYPGSTLDTHMRNRKSDELRWLICNYIVACENGLTFYGQETKSLCR